MGCLCGAVRQTEGLRLQLLLALHQDGVRPGCARSGEPHHRSVPNAKVNKPPLFYQLDFIFSTSSSFTLCLSFFFSFFFKDARDPSETTFRLFWISLKPPSENSFILGPVTSKQTQIKTTEGTRGAAHRAKDVYKKRHLRCNHAELRRNEKSVACILIFFIFYFFVALPAFVLVIAWTLSVSVDVACVGPQFRGLDGGGARMMTPER